MHLRALRACAIAAFSVAAAGCPAPDPAAGLGNVAPPDRFLDYNQFVCTVEPVLIRRCSYLACHGTVDHALRIYSMGKLRRDATATRTARSNTPLTSDEVELNFASASGLLYAASPDDRAVGNVARLPLLSKPLAARFGGGEHRGLALFPAYPAATPDDDPEWKALVAWAAGKKQPSPVDADCATLFTAMGLAPRTP